MGGLSQFQMRGLAPPGSRGQSSGSTQYASHGMNLLRRLQGFARFPTCPACGVNGHGRLTAAVTGLLLAVALQPTVAMVVEPRHFPDGVEALAVAIYEIGKPGAALAMGHLVRVHVSGFSTRDPQIHPQPRQHDVVVAPIRKCEMLWETVPVIL